MLGHVPEGGEIPRARIVELEEEAVVGQLGEDGLGHRGVAALGPPRRPEIAAAEMGAHGEVAGPVAQGRLDQLHGEGELVIRIVALLSPAGPHLLVAEIGEAHVVELEIPAARGVEVGDLRAIRRGQVLHEGVEVGIDRAIDIGAAHLRVEHGG